MVPTTPIAQASTKSDQPHCPAKASAIAAGIRTSPVPSAGMSAAMAPSTPKTTGEGSGEIQKANPTSAP